MRPHTSASPRQPVHPADKSHRRPRPIRGPAKRPSAQTFVKLLYDCDTTGQVVEYEVPSDARTVKDLWGRTLELTCPHCDQVHAVALRDAFIRGALVAGPEALLRGSSRD